jgi:hypothetical protein
VWRQGAGRRQPQPGELLGQRLDAGHPQGGRGGVARPDPDLEHAQRLGRGAQARRPAGRRDHQRRLPHRAGRRRPGVPAPPVQRQVRRSLPHQRQPAHRHGQPGATAPYEGSEAGTVEALDVGEFTARSKYLDTKKAAAGGHDLSKAEIIVSGGRGLQKPENFDEVLKPLVEALGAQMGASRPVVDAGWLPHEYQVGSSGQIVQPKLYVAVGISGAIQHLVGMKSSNFIIAINKDPDAPIFEVADVGVVGDLFEVVPALAKAVAEAKG